MAERKANQQTFREQQGANNGRAKKRRGGIGEWMRNYWLRHLQTLFYALGQLARKPFSTLMTAAVVGIALALPAGLHVLLANAQEVTTGWDGDAQLSLFLKKETREHSATALATELRARPGIDSVEYISSAQALEEFRTLSGFGEALEALEENPLPPLLVVRPALGHNDPASMDALRTELERRAEVELAQLDMAWVQRLYALMDIGRQGVMILASLLALAVLLVVGNTIRLHIQNRRDEIVVTKLIGGTDAFIRRPFLYSGLWYGLFGALIGAALVESSLLLLHAPVAQLAALYHSDFALQGLDLLTGGGLLLVGMGLGLFGSWLAVGRHLRDIEPT